MRSEADTPLEDRYLYLEGKVSPKSLELIKAGFSSLRPPDTEVIFVGFSYADLPLTKQFDIVFPRGKPQDGVCCKCRVIAVTQQWGKPFLEVPHGWNTICMIEFPEGIPELVHQLPVVDGWYQNKDWVCICDETTWESLKKIA